MNVLVVGNGVAAAGFLYNAAKLNLNCDHISSPSNAPVCSWNSTAVAALRGTQSGLSKLGDELVQGWEEANEVYKHLNCAAAERSTHTTAVFDDTKNLKRFSHLPVSVSSLEFKLSPQLVVKEECWIIRPHHFLERWKPREAMVVGLSSLGDGWKVKFLGGEEKVYDHVVLATGFWLTWMKGLFPMPEMRAVQGSYYQWQNCDWGKESFSLSIDSNNLIYHGKEKNLLLGATSVKDITGQVPDMKDLQIRWEQVSERIKKDLPSIQSAQILTGIRSVTRDRTPFSLNPQKGLHLIGGLYKNGWVMSWRLGRQTAERIS